MDPRLAKQQLKESPNKKIKTNDGKDIYINDNNENNVNKLETTITQSSPSDSPPIDSMESSQTLSTLSGTRNGVDSNLWKDIFDVKKVTDLKCLPIDTNGMSEQKATLRQPLKIGEYSLQIRSRSDERFFRNDGSELKYLHIPPAISQLNLDLNHGYEMVKDIVWGKPSNAKLDELLKWILLNRKKFMVNGELVPKELHTDFVCYRGVLSKLMVTPYETNERWVICVTKFRGTLYLCQFHETYPPPDEYFNKMSFGGFRFEQYLCSYHQNIPPEPNDFDVDHHEYCCVVRSRLMSERISHSLVFGAEMDCVIPTFKEQPGTLSNFVELKTTKVMANEYQYRNFLKHKLIKWWAQSYLVGVPSIYCGYKDSKMIVKEMEQLYIEQFPNLCAEFWSANVCLNFLNAFLSYVKEVVTIDDPNVVYQFAFQPNQDITCKRLVEPADFQILPDWYIQEF